MTDFRVACEAEVDWLAHMPGYFGARGRPQAYQLTADDARLAAQRHVAVMTTTSVARYDAKNLDATREFQRGNLQTLQNAGVTLLVGSDFYFDSSLGEIEHLKALGVDDATLLHWWSVVTPRALFPAREVGVLQPGNEASFLVLQKDPQQDLPAAVRSIQRRIKQGVPMASA